MPKWWYCAWGVLTMLKRWFLMVCKLRAVKAIDRECDKYLKLKAKLDIQRHMVNLMIDRYKEVYGEDLRVGGADHA